MAHLQNSKNKDFGGVPVIVQKQYFLRGTLKLDIETLLQKSCIVFSLRSAQCETFFAHNLISACDFCKDPQKFACFGTFG